jgi:hypothetical protein
VSAAIQIDGHKLVAVCPDELDLAAQSLLAKFAELHVKGPKLHPGSIVDFGWAPLRIEEHGGEWIVCEPDFSRDDLAFTRGVAVTLRVLRDQVRIVQLAGAEPQATRHDHGILISDGLWDAPKAIAVRGAPARKGDSGWSFVPDEDGAVAGEWITAGKLAIARPGFSSVLALPQDYSASFERDRVLTVYDPAMKKFFPERGDDVS